MSGCHMYARERESTVSTHLSMMGILEEIEAEKWKEERVGIDQEHGI